MELDKLIQAYIESKELSWSPTTLRTELSRLRGLSEAEFYNPREAYKRLRKVRGSYSIKTLFIRAAAFHDWMLKERVSLSKVNVYREFMYENGNLFKNSYKKEVIELSYKEAVERVNLIKNESVRVHALHLLRTGLRYSESCTEVDGHVVGKGSKRRRVFGTSGGNGTAPPPVPSYPLFRRALKEVGLKPHTLRKLFATELVNRGISAPDLMHILGWSNMQTAASYLQSRKDIELDKFVMGVSND